MEITLKLLCPNIITSAPESRPDHFSIRGYVYVNKMQPDEFNSLMELIKPRTLNDVLGQNHIIGPDTLLHKLLKKIEIPSIIFWGPPGCGKKSLTTVISNSIQGKNLIKLSAPTSSIVDIKKLYKTKTNEETLIHMDKIHLFNKLQEDVFLPLIETGMVTLIGTTTENPFSSLNPALLSRCRVFELKRLNTIDVTKILRKAAKFRNIDETMIQRAAKTCDGNVRSALNEFDDSPHHLYSAVCKSIRASQANAALYWLARIMATKDDPVYIAKRLVRISSEDIGFADTDALGVAVHTMHGCQMIGMPECDVILGQCVVYLARAPKSRLIYNALENAKKIVNQNTILTYE